MLTLGWILLTQTRSFRLSSPDMTGRVPEWAVYDSAGCSGQNRAPRLVWKNAPKGTKGYVLTVFDPDAPTGHGWWHWAVSGIPASANGIGGGKAGQDVPDGAWSVQNDFKTIGYGGPCPPAGPAHRYVFTLYALRVASVQGRNAQEIDREARRYAIGRATLVVRYGRKA